MSKKISQSPTIFRPDEMPSIDRGNGAKTIPFVTAKVGSQRFLNGTTIFSPSSAIAHHSHNVPESVMVIEGAAIVNIDGEESFLKTFDTTFVPANIPHHFKNASDSLPMRILWTYGSIDSTRTIIETGTTSRIDDEQKDMSALAPVYEEAKIRIKSGTNQEFESAVKKAIPLFQEAIGSRSFELDKVVESENEYVLRVGWTTVENHTVDFRNSELFQQWRSLVSEYFEEAPQVNHRRNVITGF